MSSKGFGAASPTAPLQAPAKVVSGTFNYVDTVMAGMIGASFKINEALDSATIGLARFQASIEKWQIASFKYHYPLAQYWAQKIKEDPRWVTQQIQKYFEQNLFSLKSPIAQLFWLSNVPITWLAGDTSPVPCVILSGLAGHFMGNVILNRDTLTKNTPPTQMQPDRSHAVLGVEFSQWDYTTPELQSAAQASPYGGDFGMANFDYLCFPLPLIASICATDAVAFKNAMAILFSPELEALHDRVVTLIKAIPAIGSAVTNNGIEAWDYTTNAAAKGYAGETDYQDFLQSQIYTDKQPLNQGLDPALGTPGRASESDLESNAIFNSDWMLTFLTQHLPFYFMGPRFLLPYKTPTQDGWTDADIPPVSPAYALYASYLKGSAIFGKYIGPWETRTLKQFQFQDAAALPNYRNPGTMAECLKWRPTGVGGMACNFVRTFVSELSVAQAAQPPKLPLFTQAQKKDGMIAAGVLGLLFFFG